MRRSHRTAIILFLAVAMTAGPATFGSEARAQERAEEPPAGIMPQERTSPQLDGAPDAKEKEARRPRRPPLWRGPIPDGGSERASLLGELYKQLAGSTDEKLSAQLDQAIQRVWLNSGSDTIDALVRRALKAHQSKNNELAIELLDRVVDLAPDYAEGFARRGFFHYANNDIERSVGDLRRAIALDPNHFKALDGLGDIFRELGRKKAALAVFRRLIKVHPHSTGVKTAIDQLEIELEGQGT